MPKIKLDHKNIISMYLSGKGSQFIAKELKCSKAGVQHALKLNGIPLRKEAKRSICSILGFMPTKDWFLDILPNFDSAALAAKHYEIPYSTFLDYMKRYGIERSTWCGGPRVNGRRKEIPLEEAIALSDSGYTYQQLANKYNVSYGVVFRRFKDAGYKPPFHRAADDRFRTVQWHKRKILKELNISACEICGESRALDFCHIKPVAEDGPTEAGNTLILCQTHHHCFDSGLLTAKEFALVEKKVVYAESIYNWEYPFKRVS